MNPKANRIAWAISLFSILLLYIPLIVMVGYSFLDFSSGSHHWTSDWYIKVFSNESILQALQVSLVVGFWTTLGSILLGTAAALAIERTRFPGRAVFDAVTHLPLVMPEIVMGLSLLIWFVMLRITLGTFSIVLAHITFSISYVLITVRSRLKDFDESLEEAARDLGASPWQTFWKVTLPLIFPSILSGALMAFTLSFDDFLITFFTAGVGSDTLPLKIYSMIKFGVSPEINALSTLILGATLIMVFLFFKPFQKILK